MASHRSNECATQSVYKRQTRGIKSAHPPIAQGLGARLLLPLRAVLAMQAPHDGLESAPLSQRASLLTKCNKTAETKIKGGSHRRRPERTGWPSFRRSNFVSPHRNALCSLNEQLRHRPAHKSRRRQLQNLSLFTIITEREQHQSRVTESTFRVVGKCCAKKNETTSQFAA